MAVGAADHVGVVGFGAVMVYSVVLVRTLLGPAFAVPRVDRGVVCVVQSRPGPLVLAVLRALCAILHASLRPKEDDRRLRREQWDRRVMSELAQWWNSWGLVFTGTLCCCTHRGR